MSEDKNQFLCIDDIWVHGGNNEILKIVDVDVLDNDDNLNDYCVVACNISDKTVGVLFVGYDRKDLYTYIWLSDTKRVITLKWGVSYMNG